MAFEPKYNYGLKHNRTRNVLLSKTMQTGQNSSQKIIFCDIDSEPHIYRDLMIGPNGLVTTGIEEVEHSSNHEIKAYSYDKIEDFGRQIGSKLARHYNENKNQKLKLQVNFDVKFDESETFAPFYEVLDWLQTWMTLYPDLDVYLTSQTGFLERDEVEFNENSVNEKMAKLDLDKLQKGLIKWKSEKNISNNAERMAQEIKRHFGDQFFIHWRHIFSFKSMFEKILSS